MPYLKIHSSYWVENWKGASNFPLKLRVIQSSGVSVSQLPDKQVTVTYLNKGKNNETYKHIENHGQAGRKFKVSVIIHKDDIWKESLWNNTTGKWEVNNPTVLYILKYFYKKSTVLNIVTDFINISNGKYIITNMGDSKQHFKDTVTLDLEFTSYKPLSDVKYKNDNTRVKKAIKSAKAKKVATKTTSSKKASTTKVSLAKCKRSVLVYSKKKKTNNCVKKMQKILKQKGCYSGALDGWFGQETVKAVKKFQEKYKKTIGRIHKPDGKVDEKTFKALQKV